MHSHKAKTSSTSRFALRASLASCLLIGQVAAAWASIDNTASVNGNGPGGSPVYAPGSEPSDTESVDVAPAAPGYTANKTVVSTGDDAGETIVYRVTLVNTGNVTIDNISVTDPGPTFDGNAANNLPGGLTSPSIISESGTINGDLDVGETIVYEFSYTLDQTDVDNAAGITDAVDNTASVTADDPGGNAVPPDSPGSTLTAETTIPDNSALTLAKVAFDAAFPGGTAVGTTAQNAGNSVFYRFTVTNTGNTTITGASISDDSFTGSGGLGTIALVGGTTSTTPGPAITAADVAPGETAVFEVEYVVTQTDVDNG